MSEISKEYEKLRVVVSAGVFQNRFLVKKMRRYFSEENRTYYIQEKDNSMPLDKVLGTFANTSIKYNKGF